MKRLKGYRAFTDYAVFFAALVPTLLVVLAAGICLADGDAVMALTTPAVPVYRAN